MAPTSPEQLASSIIAAIEDLPVQNAANCRKIWKEYSKQLKDSDPDYVLAVARLLHHVGHRWIAAALICYHEPALSMIAESELEEFGRGIDSWDAVDVFAGLLAGPAWLRDQIGDEVIHRWAKSSDRWWRRAALVSTVVLNSRNAGGTGDTERTLAVCRLLVDDRDDMVVKAMSWALRKLVWFDPGAVRQFLHDHDTTLAARVKREVRNKLETGRKNP